MQVDWGSNRKAHGNMFGAIGRTPMVKLQRMTEGLNANIFVKLEWYGPSGSLKDRIYYHMIEKAEKRGELKPGMTVLETSTGNAGTACAFVCAVKGYKCIIVMPVGMSEERKKLMRAYGAELIFTPGAESDVDLSLKKVQEMKNQNPAQYWVPAQFDNPDNIEAHYLTTGPEVWDQMEGRIDALVASQGSGGSLTGIGRYLREHKKDVLLYAVEPAECPLLSKRSWGPHGIEGIGDGFVPKDLDLSILNGVITTTTEEAMDAARLLAKKEGIFCGVSSGCNVAAAIKLARKHPKIKTMVAMINDTGQRYFSTALCGEQKVVEIPEREHPIDDYSKGQLDIYQKKWEIIE